MVLLCNYMEDRMLSNAHTISYFLDRQSFLYQKLLSVLRRHVNTQEDTTVSIRNLLSLLSKLF